VVIVGGGFAGLNAARALRKAPVQVTLIDKRNFHLFQPLLYQVASGGLSPADISTPIRALLRKQRNARVLLGEVTSVDVASRQVQLVDGERISYDTLVLATGASHSYFGHDEWADVAPALKTIEDATEIRKRILLAFEAAERANDPETRRASLTFVVIGGGPTGVELAGSIGELARHTLRNDFRGYDPSESRVLLLEGGDRILPSFPPSLSGKAEASLRRLGVEVRTRTRAIDVSTDHVVVERDGATMTIPTHSVIWAAGVTASPLGPIVAEATNAERTKVGQVVVGHDLTVAGHPEIFVAGDLSSAADRNGTPLRGTADVAIAEGKYVGRVITRRLSGKPVRPFKFTDFGSLAVIGRASAVAKLPFVQFSGRLAWWFWLLVHLMKLVDFQNRLTVAVQWGWNYFTRNQSARLITWPEGPPKRRTLSESTDHAITTAPDETEPAELRS